MKGPNHREEAGFSLVSARSTDTEVAVVALTEVQKLAAERRAIAEDLLSQARDFEERLTHERSVIAALAAAADAAREGEREAAERVRRARGNLALVAMRNREAQRYEELRRTEEAAKAEIAAAEERLELAHRAFNAAIDARSAQEPASAADASRDEAEAQADVDAALSLLDERRDARKRAEADVAEVRARIELLSGTNGLSAEAVKRIAERRIADALRHRTKHGIT